MGAIQKALDKFGDDTVKIIQGNLASTGTNASGETSQSLKSETTETRVTVSGKAFIYVVETGRKPGKMTPPSKLEKWISDASISIPAKFKNANSFAWAISKTHAEVGSKLFREGGRKDIITPALDDKRIDDLTDEIADINFRKTVNVIEDGIAGNN